MYISSRRTGTDEITSLCVELTWSKIRSSQNDPNSASFPHKQTRKRKSQGLELDISSVAAITENDMRNVSKKRKAVGQHQIQPTKEASHPLVSFLSGASDNSLTRCQDHNYCTIPKRDLNIVYTAAYLYGNRSLDYEESCKDHAQKSINLMEKNIEMHERLIEALKENVQLKKTNLELEKMNLENEKILHDDESRQAKIVAKRVDRIIANARAK